MGSSLHRVLVLLLLWGCHEQMAGIDLGGFPCQSNGDCVAPVRCYQGVCLRARSCNRDGNLDSGEGCDDGNTINVDACTNGCRPARCGDGVLRTDLAQDAPDFEECEPTTEDAVDYCRSDCRKGQRPRRIVATYRGGALLRDGEVWSWGDVDSQMGRRLIPPTPITMFVRPVTLHAGHNGAVVADAQAFAYELPHLLDDPNYEQVRVIQSDRRQLALTVGAMAACRVIDDGRIRCWNGRCGQATPDSEQRQPVAVSDQRVRDAAAGNGSVCAVTVDGQVHCWGDLDRWGLDEDGCVQEPATLQTGLQHVVAIAADNHSYAALHADGSVSRWGARVTGPSATLTPVREVLALDVLDLPAPAVALGSSTHTLCVLLDTGEVACWGELAPTPMDGSVRVMPDLEGVAELSVSSHRNLCVLKEDETVWCWGYNHDQELGEGVPLLTRSPVRVRGL